MEVERRTGDSVKIGGDYQFKALHEGPRVQRFWHASKQFMLKRHLALSPGLRVADIGCGSGLVSTWLVDQGLEVDAVDGNKESIEFIKNRFCDDKRKLIPHNGLVDEVNLPPNSYDYVISLEVIEHIYHDQGVGLLKSMARLLKPGGRWLITTPNYRSMWFFIEPLMDYLSKVPKLAGDQHVTKFTPPKLRSIVKESGLELDTLNGMCTLAPWLSPLSWKFAKGIDALEYKCNIPFPTILVASGTKKS